MGMMNRDILRLLDANLNRAVEGIRVLEEAARMLRNDDGLTRELKDLRHALVGVFRGVDGLDSRMLFARDSEGDVLREGDTPSERTRDGIGGIVRANAGRAEEAVRSLEEYVKTIHPELSAGFKRVRFGLYDVEKKLSALVNVRETLNARRLGVVVVFDRAEMGTADIAAPVRSAAGAGAGIIVYRDMTAVPGGEMLREAAHVAEVCQGEGAAFLVGGRPDIALLAGADGLHLETGDLPPERCRALIGRDMVLGVTLGADCLRDGCAPEADFVMAGVDGAVEDLEKYVLRVDCPVVAMGRFDADGIRAILSRGGMGVGIRPRRDDLPEFPDSVAAARRVVEQYSCR